MHYSFIIIEDLKENIESLKTDMMQYPDFICKGTASTLQEGISLTLEQKPNIIFLDVELGNESGFDLLENIRNYFGEMPFIIILSELEKYAKKAINNEICYFLDKPVNPIQLSLALHKFRKHFAERQSFLTIKDKSGHWFIQHSNILYVQADSNYSYIHRINNKRITVTKTLKDIELMLPKTFLRVHKSYIINITYIEKINTTLKFIMLNVKIGIFDLTPSKGKSEDQFPAKEIVMDVPIGEMYLEKVKNTLLTSKNL
ncbi:MAG: LytTR family DNA-binding domain-containing protein [Flavobacterium sp.]|nr:LytTR family DNA-binding domain-containing protein [Flavobacterium sp.]